MNYLTTSKVVAYLAIIFVAGGAAGAVITLRNAQEHQVQPASMERACTRFQDRLVSKLSLTPEQITRLQPVFDQTAQELRAIHANALRNTDDVIRRAHERIARELTPEQKAKLQAFDEERQEWLRRHLQAPDSAGKE
jgi:Spy/CpxP family protein refolding chaperone